MSTLNKKRKLQHDSTNAGTPGDQRGGATLVEDPRFQMDSDFSDYDLDDNSFKGFGTGAVSIVDQRPSKSPAGEKKTRRNGAQHKASKAAGGGTRGGARSGDDDGDEGSGDTVDGGSDISEGNAGGAAVPAANYTDSGQPGLSPDDYEKADDGDGGGDGNGSGKSGSVSGDANPDAGQQEMCRRKKVLTKRKLQRVKEASDRRGIVYISRIPPHMKPHKLRQLLEPFGDIGRVYCAPEDPALRRLRKKKGGNSGKNFTEGWVEFEDKRRAKRAALALNGQPIGGSKRSAYHYDLWNLKYLPKFKWDTLTEEINYQRAVREQRLITEISAAKRERDFYLSRVDKAKAISAIQERRLSKQQQQQRPGGGAGSGGTGGDGGSEKAAGSAPAAAAPLAETGDGASTAAVPPPRNSGPRFERHFGQRQVKADPVLDERAPVLADDVLGLLGRKRKAQQ